VIYEMLRPEHFYMPKHQAIFTAMTKMFFAGIPIDLITLYDQQEQMGQIEVPVETQTYNSQLVADVTHVTNLAYYAAIILRKYKLRAITGEAATIYSQAIDEGGEPEAVLDLAITRLTKIAQVGSKRGAVSIAESAAESLETFNRIADGEQRVAGISTGFSAFDGLINGLHPGELMIIGARPSVGKSALCLDLARSAATQGYAVAIFSLEMRHEELSNRMLAAVSDVSLTQIREGNASTYSKMKLDEAASALGQMQIFIDDSSKLRPHELLARARVICARNDLKVLFIDYLQLMDVARSKDSRQQEITAISRALKQIARELGLCIVAFSQLSRECEKAGRQPRLSDLRESGSLEQDADVVVFLHLPPKDKQQKQNGNRLVDVIVAKQRNGPCGKFQLMFRSKVTSFANASDDEPEICEQEEDLPF
jgi:replicative DNA helicase